jgi:adenosine/AMP kinase
MEWSVVPLRVPAECNVIVGQAHFIKTVEDLYEIVMGGVPGARFGVAFNEASGPCLVRRDGNDAELTAAAVEAARAIGAGHVFVLVLRGAYPVNLLNAIKLCPEVCRVFCATANPVQAIVVQTEQGRGMAGVVDGEAPHGVEDESAQRKRHEFLRAIGYKR